MAKETSIHMNCAIPDLVFPSESGKEGISKILNRVAEKTLQILIQEGELNAIDYDFLFSACENESHSSSGFKTDFLHLTAQNQAQKNALSVEGELFRLQKALRNHLVARVHQWSFGHLPGRQLSLYDKCQSLREICMTLGCPSMLVGESSVIHVASINPVSALVASDWINHELRNLGQESAFIFSFCTDLSTWETMMHKHFKS
jgi:hypothetical protein